MTPDPCVAPSIRTVIALAILAISETSFASDFDAEKTIAAELALNVPIRIGVFEGSKN